MMTGTVVDGRPTVLLIVRGPDEQEAEIEAVIDTGFSGFLALPAGAVVALGLPFLNYFTALLADGGLARLEVYGGWVVWNGVEQEIEVLAAGREALLGVSLLVGHDLHIEFTDGGRVTIDPL